MGSGNENSDDASRKRKKRSERGRERRCVYLDLHLGRNLRRLYENMKREEQEEENRERRERIVDSVKRRLHQRIKKSR